MSTIDQSVEVLDFIHRFLGHQESDDSEASEILRRQFTAGYCWHFAHILKATFSRGTICWAAPRAHIIWLDTNDQAYDIEGLFSSEITRAYLPVDELDPRFTYGFKHTISADQMQKRNPVTTDHIELALLTYLR